MKKILFVIESLSVGGAEKIVTTFVKNLDKTKYDIDVLTVVKTGVYVNEISRYCKLIFMLPDYTSLTSFKDKIDYKIKYKKIYNSDIRKIYQSYIKEQYDVEIAFVEGFTTKFVAASSNKKSRKFAWLHTDMEQNIYADQFYSSLQEEKESYQKLDCIYAVSGSVKEAFERKFDLWGKVQVQYNPVDSEEIKKKAVDYSKIEERQWNRFQTYRGMKFVTVGRLEEQKGYDRLLQSVNELKEKCTDFCIWILGSGSKQGEFEHFIKENELENYIVFTSFQKNPYPWIKEADAFLCSSRAEGFSTVATEALILGKPIFTTDCAGMKELFGESNCGKIFENSQEGVDSLLEYVLTHTELLKDYEKQVEERAKDFQIEVRMQELEKILDE